MSGPSIDKPKPVNLVMGGGAGAL